MATSFQQSVWEAIAQIPRGRVTTYSEIARFIGRPRAVRAVGTAVGQNPMAPQVPCHRVVPMTGKVGNYSGPGGRSTKIELLNEEGVLIEQGCILNLGETYYSYS